VFVSVEKKDGLTFDKAIASFGLAYADQSTEDFEEFTQAIRVGKIRAAKLAPQSP
jgi:hypothetical protein